MSSWTSIAFDLPMLTHNELTYTVHVLHVSCSSPHKWLLIIGACYPARSWEHLPHAVLVKLIKGHKLNSWIRLLGKPWSDAHDETVKKLALK